jgi:hypothetical protein
MQRNAALILLIFCGWLCAQDNLKEQLLNYDFNRLKISISARSMTLNCILVVCPDHPMR